MAHLALTLVLIAVQAHIPYYIAFREPILALFAPVNRIQSSINVPLSKVIENMESV
jgi:hypothetical protein